MSCAAIVWWAIMTLLYHNVHTPSPEKETVPSDHAHFSPYTVFTKGILLCVIPYTCCSCKTNTAVKSWVNDKPISLLSYMPDDSFMTTGKSSSVLNIQHIRDLALYYWVSDSWHCEQHLHRRGTAGQHLAWLLHPNDEGTTFLRTVATTHRSQRHIPEDPNLQNTVVNLKSCMSSFVHY